MGKKGRRTRWRTLTITDEHSDSEESTSTSGHRAPKGYPQKSYYSRFTYSSQSTPTRRYQCDGTKSTRSSSTASENKITFNEDEYTRITTPRQDVLFKKGYLNKPKTYQTQTSTGNSTTSTGNSTGNGTPDHQSTDLEYESQFVFPNGFVDQNGIYYVNSFEPYPVMVYNPPPTYYPEYTNVKKKRCSTGSLTESTSPNNEETSQDLSQSETPSNISDVNVYSVVYPGYYYNGACPPQDVVSEPEPRRVKKRRRRKLSRSKQDGTTSESSDEILTDEEKQPKTEETGQADEKEEETKKKSEEDETKTKNNKYDLKPDAEEFVPRAYRQPETIPIDANVQFIKIPPNFVPMPILNPMGEFNAFIPHGIPVNFLPQSFVNFVPYKPITGHGDEKEEEEERQEEEEQEEEKKKEETKETVEVPKNQIDIAKIVSKLEEAAKEQEDNKEETSRSVPKKRHKFQKVDLKKPEEKKVWNSPKKDLPKPVRNYSETLKKSIAPSVDRQKNAEKEKIKSTIKEPVKNQRIERVAPKISNEWIAVSRKKRKNKNVEENEDFDEKTEQNENIIAERLEPEPLPPPSPEPLPQESLPPPPPPLPKIEEVKEEKKPKKKTRKNHAKTTPTPITKRVIITDVDLSQEIKKVEEEEEVKIDDETKIEEETKMEETKVEEEVVEEARVDEVKVVEEEKEEEREEKKEVVEEEKKEVLEEDKKEERKTKKKKKKVKPIISSQSSSDTTLNVADDSYDFLFDESLDKTNLEVSYELDKMIQRGMYSSLEEKIKSMNIESNASFFKTIISTISSRESSVEKTPPYIKTPPLTRLIGTSNTLKPACSISTTRSPNDFLSETTTLEGTVDEGGATSDHTSDELYPITRAVKEWMTKTRETTPDVEIFKSPSTIFREFGDEAAVLSRQTSTSSIEEAEEVVEEDFQKVELPKHGNLPYRAICCSIM